MKKLFTILLSSAIMVNANAIAQDFKMPSPSPLQTIVQQFSTTGIEVSYSRPSAKGRKIFGDLVPFEKMWRTGANGSTTLTFKEDVIIEGQKVPAGSYALYATPYKEVWVITLNKGAKNWGLSGYKEDENVLIVKVPVNHNEKMVETFTIKIDNITNTSALLNIAWEHTFVNVKIEADNKAKILEYLDKELKGPKPPYQQAANYYLENNYKLDQAITYVNKAIELNKDAFWLHWLKARIYAKLGNKNDAINAATKAADMAKGSDYETEYYTNMMNLINELK